MSWWEIVLIAFAVLGFIVLLALSAYGEYKRHKAYMLERAEQLKLYRALLFALHKYQFTSK